MPQAIAETVFDIGYLCFAIATGAVMLLRGRGPLVKKAGWMTFLLGAGDSFHLVPRCWALWTTGLAANAAALGFGKFVTSITMTVFYLLLYYVWQDYYRVEGRRGLTAAVWGLAAVRIALCLLPQNRWLSYRQPLFYGVLRNIPFAALGVLIILIYAQKVRETGDDTFRRIPLAVGLSFGFYLPVVLFSGTLPVVGILMIPKTMAYVWIILMCRRLYRRQES